MRARLLLACVLAVCAVLAAAAQPPPPQHYVPKLGIGYSMLAVPPSDASNSAAPATTVVFGGCNSTKEFRELWAFSVGAPASAGSRANAWTLLGDGGPGPAPRAGWPVARDGHTAKLWPAATMSKFSDQPLKAPQSALFAPI